MMELSLDKRQLCDIQGRLFELALKSGYESPIFIEAFMNSRAAACLDDTYDRLQWAGEEYILEELEEETAGVLQKADETFSGEVMYWIGYIYRYWHYYTGESSREIYKIAGARTMEECWLGFHTLDVEMAIDDLKEIYRQRVEEREIKMKEQEEFAAHVRKESDGIRIQTVKEHCLETAELCKKYAHSIGIDYIAYVAAVLHDIGKITQKFDDYVRGNKSYHRGDIDHSYAGARYIIEFCVSVGSEFYDVSHFIARIIISHHGLHDWVLTDGTDYLIRRTSKDENFETIKSHVPEIISEDRLKEYIIFANREYHEIRQKLKSLSRRNRTAFAFYMGMFEREMQSILIDADRTNTAEFMMNRKIEYDYDRKLLFKSFRGNYEVFMKRKAEDFSLQNARIVRRRNDISNRCKDFARHEAGICQLIVPTGGGKTLSSLRYAIEYGIEHDTERIIYVAPFMSILDQNSDVFKEIVGEDNFLEHHSNVVQEIDDEGELAEYELYAARWDKPVIATTMVQFLNTLFLGKTSSVRRMHRFSRAVIIVDEVQSLPLKCVNLFHLAMNFLKGMCKSVIVLCSATQPDFTKSDYPILMDENSQMIGDYREDFAVFKRTQIIPKIGTRAYTYDQAAEFCKNIFEKNRNLLIIVNTKKSVAEMREKFQRLISQDDMEEDVSIVCMSTNLCPEHRRVKLDILRESDTERESNMYHNSADRSRS